ncbi:MAG: hypothetical protein FWG18_03480, partial [Alphaproteobacteria bacterium]|nr:hypothetical protein [Alphaproteobacteria bacterium]
MVPIERILQLLENSGFRVLGADMRYIWLEDPTCITRSAGDFVNIAWIAISVVTVFLLLGWAIALIRGGKLTSLVTNLRNLFLMFATLSLAVPIANAIWGHGDLMGRGCDKIGVPIEEVQRILAARDSNLKAWDENDLYEEFDIYDSAAGRDISAALAEALPQLTGVEPSENSDRISGIVVISAGGAYDGRIYGGMCTPSAQSRIFANRNFTTGQYAQSDAPFDKAMNTIFRAEGGYSNHPLDSGGETKYGISRAANPNVDIKNITRADAERIAYDRYYKKYGIDKLPDAIRGDVFHAGWGTGPRVAIKQFQEILGVPKTGSVDTATISAAQNYSGDLRGRYVERHRQYLRDIVERKPS